MAIAQDKQNIFESHPKMTLIVVWIGLLCLLYGLVSLKICRGQSLKKCLHQYYVSKIIDNNLGRFIKLREHRPNHTWVERPSKKYMSQIAPNSIERKYYRITTDSEGFISPSHIYDNPELKIVFLGGSTTECLYMQENERFPFRVGRIIEAKLNKRVNSYNGGVSANESLHSLNILLNKVLPLKPQIVVLMHNINDLVVLRSQGTYWYLNSLKSHVQTAKNVFSEKELPLSEGHMNTQEIIEAFQRNLKTFIAICRIHHIQPVLMTQANRIAVDGDPLYHQLNEVIRQTGKMENILVVDLAQAIPSSQTYLYDAYHYTAKGSKLAAKVIAEQLQSSC